MSWSNLLVVFFSQIPIDSCCCFCHITKHLFIYLCNYCKRLTSHCRYFYEYCIWSVLNIKQSLEGIFIIKNEKHDDEQSYLWLVASHVNQTTSLATFGQWRLLQNLWERFVWTSSSECISNCKSHMISVNGALLCIAVSK